MIVNNYYSDAYNWNVIILYNVQCTDFNKVSDYLMYNDCSKQAIKRAYNYLKECNYNKGLTYTNSSNRTSIIIVGKTKCKGQCVNTIIHEAYHMTQNITQLDNLNEEEQANFIGEFIMSQYYILTNM